jgi:hypothetical protein
MGRMSDLALLAEQVADRIADGHSVEEAIDTVEQNTVYDRSEIEMAYRGDL